MTTLDKLVKTLGYNTYTAYEEYTPVTKEQLNSFYGRYIKRNKEEKMNVDNNVTVTVGNRSYYAKNVEMRQSCGEYPELDINLYLAPYNRVPTAGVNNQELSIKEVIFNPPATIVFWSDNTKTVVKARGEFYDPEKGIAMAISKKMLGDNKYEYYNLYKHWLKKWNKQSKHDSLINYLEQHLTD